MYLLGPVSASCDVARLDRSTHISPSALQSWSGPLSLIAALHVAAPPASYVPCQALAFHDVTGQLKVNFTTNETATATASPSATPSQTPSKTASASTPGGPLICMTADCSMKFGVVASGANATFEGYCVGTQPIAWCAFGITLDPTGGMYPAGAAMRVRCCIAGLHACPTPFPKPVTLAAEVFMLQTDATGKVVVSLCLLWYPFQTLLSPVPLVVSQFLEDRQNTAFASPACYSAQVSQLLNFSVQNSGPSTIVSATWTRPLQLPASLTDQGYVNLAPGLRSHHDNYLRLYPVLH